MCYRKYWIVAILFAVNAFLAGRAIAQTTITGEVRDVNTYEQIRGVNIFLKGTGIGTTSNYTGHYSLKIPTLSGEELVVFRHVGYEVVEMSLDSLRKVSTVYMQPRIILLPGVEVEAEEFRELEIEKDIPQTVSVIESRNFEIQGYVDAGDLLRIDHSVQVEENLSGEKTISIRGGNADEVVVLYNGVKLNNAYDNIYDLSLIDLSDIDRFEIIKGSNTALYGPEAFSGVVNIVPQFQYDYNIRFQQRLGTYRSGNWGLHFYKKFGPLNLSYSHKRGGIEREFENFEEGRSRLDNSSLHHTANLSYSFSEHDDGTPKSSLGFMWLYTEQDYTNQRDNELLDNFNNLISGKFTGSLFGINNIDISVSWRHLEEDQFLSFTEGTITGARVRGIEDRALHVNAEKGFKFGRTDLLLAYQLQRAELIDEFEEDNGFGPDIIQRRPLSSDYERLHHGLVGILKYTGETDSDFMRDINVDLSVRHDRVEDTQTDVVYEDELPASQRTGLFDENDWAESMAKFSVSLQGYRNDLSTNAFFNFGRNVKFPTLFQQVSTFSGGTIEPEENRSLEFGVAVSREMRDHRTIYGWRVSGNYFLNNYDNKIVEVERLLGGRSEFLSTPVARISGFETKSSLFLFKKKLTLSFGWSRYAISEKSAFPFKSDFKRTLSANLNHAGYSFQVHWFKEGEQSGLLLAEELQQGTRQVEVFLPDYANLDVHLSKTFVLGPFELFANASGRNLLDDEDVELLGLNIRDRRFYLTVGAQY